MTVSLRPGVTAFAATLPRADGVAARPPALESPALDRPAEVRGGPSFADRVGDLLRDVNHRQLEAQGAAEAYADGTRNDIHGTMIALEQADITFRLVSSVRSRLIEAYREVMRMGA